MNEMLIILKFFFQGVPETAALIFTCLAMTGKKTRLYKILAYAFVFSILMYVIREASIVHNVPFGLHSIFGLIVLVFIIHRISNTSIGIVTFICCSVLFLLMSIEFFISLISRNLLNYNINYFMPNNNNILWIIMGWPQIIILWVVGWIIQNYRPFFINFLGGCKEGRYND